MNDSSVAVISKVGKDLICSTTLHERKESDNIWNIRKNKWFKWCEKITWSKRISNCNKIRVLKWFKCPDVYYQTKKNQKLQRILHITNDLRYSIKIIKWKRNYKQNSIDLNYMKKLTATKELHIIINIKKMKCYTKNLW